MLKLSKKPRDYEQKIILLLQKPFIGKTLHKQDSLNDAEGHFRKTLKIFTKAYGTNNHPKIAKIIDKIGMVAWYYISRKKQDEAKDYFQKALDIKNKCMELKTLRIDNSIAAKTV